MPKLDQGHRAARRRRGGGCRKVGSRRSRGERGGGKRCAVPRRVGPRGGGCRPCVSSGRCRSLEMGRRERRESWRAESRRRGRAGSSNGRSHGLPRSTRPRSPPARPARGARSRRRGARSSKRRQRPVGRACATLRRLDANVSSPARQPVSPVRQSSLNLGGRRRDHERSASQKARHLLKLLLQVGVRLVFEPIAKTSDPTLSTDARPG